MTDPSPNEPPSKTGFTSLGEGYQPPSTKEIQALLPNLEILAFIGHGGMGTIYKARQPKLDRIVAVKILIVDPGSDASLIEGFKREAKAMAGLMHPHIIMIYDFGETDSTLYLIMEYVEGDILERLIDFRGFGPKDVVKIATQVCDALDYAHGKGVIHRDIRPGNTMLDSKGQVKVGDFGLARLVGEELFRHNLTETNEAMGTMDYVAPEQAEAGMTVDHRADIYSVGMMLYKLFTRTLPRGSFVVPSKLVPDLDPRIDGIIVRCMQRDPENRYQSAKELRKDLEALLAKPGAASGAMAGSPKPASQGQPQTKVAIPKRRPVAAYVILAVILVGGLAFLLSRGDKTEPPTPAAPPPDQAAVAQTPTHKIEPPSEQAQPTPEPVPKPPDEAPVVSSENPDTGGAVPATDIAANPEEPEAKPEPAPVAAEPAAEPTEPSDPHLAELDARFKARYQTDVQLPYDTAIASLNESYVSKGVARARAAAQAAGNLTEVTAFDEVKARIERGEGVPPEDEPGTPDALRELRAIYRTAHAKIETQRAAKAASLYGIYLKALDEYVTELTRSDRIEDARRVKTFRDGIAAEMPVE